MSLLINSLKKIRYFITKLYVVPRTMEHLQDIRIHELSLVIDDLEQTDKILLWREK